VENSCFQFEAYSSRRKQKQLQLYHDEKVGDEVPQEEVDDCWNKYVISALP
jgi:hypothetical protein